MKANNTFTLWIFAIILLTCQFFPLHAQPVQEIMAKLNLYQQKYPEEIAYLHTDRDRYASGETIWFNAYILEEIGNQKNPLSDNLYVALVDQDGLEVAYTMLKIKGNEVSGNLLIPKLLTTGNYLLIVHTGWMKNTPADRFFTRELIIDNQYKRPLSINIKLNDTLYLPGAPLTASVYFTDIDGQPVAASFIYSLSSAKGEIGKGIGKTDKTGKTLININLPVFDANENLQLLVSTDNKNNNSSARIVIPTPDNFINVAFYPESGMFIYGADTKLAFRAFNTADRPVDFEGQIFNTDNHAVASITSTYKGMGSFNLTPAKGQTYYLKITSPAGITKTFNLPVPRRSGLNMSLTAKTNDSLKFQLTQVNKGPQIYHFIGQMKGRVYWIESRRISNDAEITVPTESFPAGVAEFAAFDSLKNLVAKRLVFVNENQRLHIDIITDKSFYIKREKVLATIKVTDNKGNPVEAVLSLSAANKEFQQSLPDNNNFLSFTKLTSDLIGYIPTPLYYLSEARASGEALDNLLIANAFKCFTWKTVLNIQEKDASFTKLEKEVVKNADFALDKEAAAYYAKILSTGKLIPGISGIIQEKNNMDKILNPDKVSTDKDFGYETEQSIMAIVRKIKPYQMVGGKIIFSGSGPNSFNAQQGAAIAIDGILRGTDPSVLEGIPVSDIERINVSTNPVDVQRYTGLNSQGIIEVYTKSANLLKKNQVSEIPVSNVTERIVEFESPDYNDPSTKIKPKTDLRKTVYWKAPIQTDKSGHASVTFFNCDIPSDVVITVEGHTTSGLTGSNTAVYSVK